MERRGTRLALGGWAVLVVLFLWVPLVLICVYAFNASNIPVEAQEAAQHEASMAQRQREERETTARLAELHMKITERTKMLREVNRAVAEIKKHLRAARPE